MRSIFASVLLVVFLTASASFGGSHGEEKMEKKGILIAAFGTSVPEAKKAIDNLVGATKQAFPEVEVRLCYTSNIIRRKIAKEQNVVVPTPVEALAQMNDEGFTDVCVMPSHIIPGEEYDEMRNVVDAFRSLKGKYGFRKIELGKPFLFSMDDCDRMARILARRFAKPLEERGGVVVLMGHGTPLHIANALYSQLQLALDKVAYGKFFLGTVEAAPTIEDVISKLGRKGAVSKITLSPFMIVAGDHAKNDMADKEDPESWISLLSKAGYKNVVPWINGLGEDPQISELFVDRIRDTMK